MKVKTLIKKLEKMNPEAEARLNYHDGDVALFALSSPNIENVVWLEGENDIDLGNELSARYEYAADPENGIDELDFYMDLLEIGITVKMVHKYMGTEKANHMKEFCEEHGLI